MVDPGYLLDIIFLNSSSVVPPIEYMKLFPFFSVISNFIVFLSLGFFECI